MNLQHCIGGIARDITSVLGRGKLAATETHALPAPLDLTLSERGAMQEHVPMEAALIAALLNSDECDALYLPNTLQKELYLPVISGFPLAPCEGQKPRLARPM